MKVGGGTVLERGKGAGIMASNFRILTHQNSESIHLKLIGDFDGSSAYELLNAIKRCSSKANRVFIHTDGLKEIHPFGKAVFQNSFHGITPPGPGGFIFTGEKLVP